MWRHLSNYVLETWLNSVGTNTCRQEPGSNQYGKLINVTDDNTKNDPCNIYMYVLHTVLYIGTVDISSFIVYLLYYKYADLLEISSTLM